MPAPGAVASTVPEEFAQLVAAFAAITDPRFARGKVHPLPGVLALSRRHWGIENRLFHSKDDSFGEDRHVLPSHPTAILAALDGL
jgi:hypothetical protein